MANIFTADAETGDVSTWTESGGGIFNTGGTNAIAVVSSGVRRSGSFSYKAEVTNATTTRAVRYMRWTDDAWEQGGQMWPDTAYYSTWMYMPWAHTMSWWNIFQFKSDDAGGVSDPTCLPIAHHSAGEIHWVFRNAATTWPSYHTTATPSPIASIPLGEWVFVKARVTKSHTSSGRFEFWHNDYKVFDTTGPTVHVSGGPDHTWGLGNYSDGIDGPAGFEDRGQIFFDDCKVDTLESDTVPTFVRPSVVSGSVDTVAGTTFSDVSKPAGSNLVLVVIVGCEGTAPNVHPTDIIWGAGNSLTEVTTEAQAATGIAVWAMLDTDMPGTPEDIVITAPSPTVACHLFVENVEQDLTEVGSASTAATSAPISTNITADWHSLIVSGMFEAVGSLTATPVQTGYTGIGNNHSLLATAELGGTTGTLAVGQAKIDSKQRTYGWTLSGATSRIVQVLCAFKTSIIGAQSTASLPATAYVGQANAITVTVKDNDGNNKGSGGDTVVITVSGDYEAMPTVTDVGDGTYTCSFTPSTSGVVSIGVTVNGLGVVSNPQAVTVEIPVSNALAAYLYAPGTAGNFYAASVNHASHQITGDIELGIDGALQWSLTGEVTYLSKYDGLGNRGYRFFSQTAGADHHDAQWSTDGTAIISDAGSGAHSLTDFVRRQIWFALDVDDGASGSVRSYYTRDPAVSALPLTDSTGRTLMVANTVAGVTSIHPTTQPAEVAGFNGGGLLSVGQLYRAIIRSGIGGTLVWDVDFTDEGAYNAGKTTITEKSANALTVNLNGTGWTFVPAFDFTTLPWLGAAEAVWLGAKSNGDYGSGSVNHPWPDLSRNDHHLRRGATDAASTDEPTFDTDHFSFDGGDLFEALDDAGLDFTGPDPFVLLFVCSIPDVTPAANAVIVAKKDGLDNTTAGFALYVSTAGDLVGHIADGTNGATASLGLPGTGVMVVGLERDVTNDEIRVSINGIRSSGTTDPTTATLANARPLRVGAISNATPANFLESGSLVYGGALIRDELSQAELDEAIAELISQTTAIGSYADAAQTTSTVQSPRTPGEVSAIVVTAKNSGGTPLTLGGDDVEVIVSRIIAAGGEDPGDEEYEFFPDLEVTDNGDGTYSASFSSLEADTYTVEMFINGVEIGDSPRSIVVGPDVGDAATSAAIVPPSGTTGEPVALSMTVRDQYGNLVPGATVTIEVTGANSAITPDVVDNADGTYDGTYTPLTAGSDSLAITLNSTAISGSPFAIEISASVANNFLLHAGSADHYVSTPDQAAFDVSGDAEWRFGGEVLADISGAWANRYEATGDDRNWRFAYNSTTNLINLLLGSGTGTLRSTQAYAAQVDVLAVPMLVRVRLDADNGASNTTVTWEQKVAAGTRHDAIESDDDWTDSEVDTITGVQTWKATALPIHLGADNAAGTLLNFRNWVFYHWASIDKTSRLCSFNPRSADQVTSTPPDYTGWTDYDGLVWTVQSAGVEYHFPVAASCTATIDDPVDAGVARDFAVTTVDNQSDPFPYGGHDVAIAVTGANASNPAVTDVGDGTYTAQDTPTSGGTDTVDITFDGDAISGSPFSVEVSAAGGGATLASVSSTALALDVGIGL